MNLNKISYLIIVISLSNINIIYSNIWDNMFSFTPEIKTPLNSITYFVNKNITTSEYNEKLNDYLYVKLSQSLVNYIIRIDIYSNLIKDIFYKKDKNFFETLILNNINSNYNNLYKDNKLVLSILLDLKLNTINFIESEKEKSIFCFYFRSDILSNFDVLRFYEYLNFISYTENNYTFLTNANFTSNKNQEVVISNLGVEFSNKDNINESLKTKLLNYLRSSNIFNISSNKFANDLIKETIINTYIKDLLEFNINDMQFVLTINESKNNIENFRLENKNSKEVIFKSYLITVLETEENIRDIYYKNFDFNSCELIEKKQDFKKLSNLILKIINPFN